MPARNSHVIVRKHHPILVRLAYVALFFLVLLFIWFSFDYGRGKAGFDSNKARQERNMLLDRIDDMQATNAELRHKNAELVQAAEVDREAYAQVEKSLTRLQDEILELQQEVAFYQGIVSPNESARGLRIQAFKLAKNEGTTTFHFDLVLSQLVSRNRVVRGSADVTIEGMLDGKIQNLSLKELMLGERKSMNFRFKFFQRLEGDIALPEGFLPLKVRVRAIPSGARGRTVKRSWDWNELTA